MPKGQKPAPPQQASLNEMWGKKREASTSAAPPKKEEEMDVDVKPQTPEGSVTASTMRANSQWTHSWAVEEERD